jgi:hypothetical protein
MIVHAEGLKLRVSPLLEAIPIGAPVRIIVSLTNTSDKPLTVPSSLSMETGNVTGQVVNPAGKVRTYSSAIRHIDEMKLRRLEPGQSISNSLILLRGGKGVLFQSLGVHKIIVDAAWAADGVFVKLTGETSVVIKPPVDEAHAKAALQIISTPDPLLTSVVGGDHLEEGTKAIRAGIGNPVLRPHFAFIEAKRIGMPFGKRPADLKGAADLLDEETVMSPAEIKAAAEMVRNAGKEAPVDAVRHIVKILRIKIKQFEVDDGIAEIAKSL